MTKLSHSKPRAIIADCSVSGHRETYYKQFARTLHEMGYEVFLIAPRGGDLPAEIHFIRIHHKPLHNLPNSQPLQKKLTVLRNALIRVENLIALRRQAAAINPDVIFFPCLDDMLPVYGGASVMERIFPFSWSGLLVQSALPPFRKLQPDIRPALQSKNCLGAGILNEFSAQALLPFQKRIIRFPDFADLSEPDREFPLLQELQQRAGGRKIISLLGSLHPRKGIDLFLRSCERLPAEEYFFFMAGKPSLSPDQAEQISTFEKEHENCLFSTTRIPDERCFNALVAQSDLIFAVYINFTGSSNLLTKAAAFCKPVIVGDGECMRKRVNDYNTGASINSQDEEDCIRTIRQLCNQQPNDRSHYDNYLTDHQTDKLSDCFQELMDTPAMSTDCH